MLWKRSEGSSVSRDWERKKRTETQRETEVDRERKQSQRWTPRESSEGGLVDGETMS